ncbi:MAG: hypothetical protein Q9219_002736 [cf. Caloplaca sp. 3 TL-2023]
MVETRDKNVTERISQLNEIDKDIAKLLQSAGEAMKTITTSAPDLIEGESDEPPSIEQRKEDFTSTSGQYFALLSSIDIRLRRQISALEDAGIISAGATAKDTQSQASADAASSIKSSIPTRNTVSVSGLSNLDAGWLNSRNNNIENMMEAELWKNAQELISRVSESEARSETDHTTARSNGSANSLR